MERDFSDETKFSDHTADILCKELGYNESVDWYGVDLFYKSGFSLIYGDYKKWWVDSMLVTICEPW